MCSRNSLITFSFSIPRRRARSSLRSEAPEVTLSGLAGGEYLPLPALYVWKLYGLPYG
jgi:hypothetical protein